MEMITVVNKSGKVVNTSKHLMSVFKEAKLAYQERKAEIKADRQGKLEEKQARLALESMSIDDCTHSRHSSRTCSRRHRSQHRRGPELRVRPPTERHHSGSSVRSATTRSRSVSGSPRQSSHSVHQHSYSAPSSPDRPDLMMARRHTSQNLEIAPVLPPRPSPLRRQSTSAIDMDLAYGEYHAPTLQAQYEESKDLSSLVQRAKGILDEADCAHASVTAIIQHLQKNPDAMAAVALTLAEISNIASKMAPGALTALKGTAPAVFALLASPQFLIAAGVGVGITVVMLGGYKIIKKIKAKRELDGMTEREGSMDEALELTSSVDLDRIEHWRRGIADEDAAVGDTSSMISGTSVEGEFITPVAANMRRSTANLNTPMQQGRHFSSRRKASSSSSHAGGDDRSSSSSTFSSRRKKKSSKESSSSSSSSKKKKDKDSDRASQVSVQSGPLLLENGTGSENGDDLKRISKVKKPSPLRMMFKS